MHSSPVLRRDNAWRAGACPSCGHQPTSATEAANQREDLTVAWLEQAVPGGPVGMRRHCTKCQPHGSVAAIVCTGCGDGPLLSGDLAVGFDDGGICAMEPVRAWLADHGWRGPFDRRSSSAGEGLVCPRCADEEAR
ncbi:MAG: hypothetical protein ACRDMV_17095 [Streptosporangiales bacterium]